MLRRPPRTGFTLIELLIVVAIIAILAAIAVPNFLEAQVRAKVTRVHADFRTLATALEAYQVDNAHYPPDRDEMTLAGVPVPNGYAFNFLTTPVAYLSSIPTDKFFDVEMWPTEPPRYWYQGEGWRNHPVVKARAIYGFRGKWIASSHGPDLFCDFGETALLAGEVPFMTVATNGTTVIRRYPEMIYDPTNGTVSSGDLVRWGP
ncbi:MAG TPA: prepilin-type N-terminal cleavage/methylation domain-containing protein [Candidatus Sumerlaeota bacterium]|nr:prepilin-type N-terminal cleavage/methylation domain-containing protein [Candidatus Sumerlaeota bacterium]